MLLSGELGKRITRNDYLCDNSQGYKSRTRMILGGAEKCEADLSLTDEQPCVVEDTSKKKRIQVGA